MRRWLLIGALGVAAAGGIYFATTRGDAAAGSGGRIARIGGRRTAAPASGLTVAAAYDFTAAPTLPICVGDPHCVMLCKVTSTPAWQCFDNTGAQVSGMTQGSGTTYVGTFAAGVSAINDVTAATAPTASMAALDSLLDGTHNITVVGAGYATTQENATFQHFFYHFNAAGLYVRREGSNFACAFNNSNATVGTAGVSELDGWVVWSCRKNGTSHVARVNGVNGTPVVGADGLAPDPTTAYFGSRASGTLAQNGPAAWVGFYDEAKSDAWTTSTENAWWGLPSTVTNVASVTQLLGKINGSNVDFFQANAAITDSALGVHTLRGFTNSWSADSTDFTGATPINSPVITTNVASGPLARWKNAPEVDRVVDASAVAFVGGEGAASTPVRSGVGGYTASFILAAGDTGVTKDKARIAWVTDGSSPSFACDATLSAGACVVSGSGCNFSGLTASYVRIGCVMLATTPTSVKAQLLVGNATADTGSLLVAHGQTGQGTFADLPTADNVAHGSGWIQVTDASAWPSSPTSPKGKYEAVFVPQWNINATWAQPDGNIYLFDANTGSQHAAVMVPGYTSLGAVLGALRSAGDGGGGVNDLIAGSVSTTPGATYVIALAWAAHGAGCDGFLYFDSCPAAASCHATTLLKSDTSGTGSCPQAATVATLGNRFDGSVPTSVWIPRVTIFR